MGFFSGKKKKDRVFGLGIDGAPCTLLKDLSARGVMPNLSKLIDSGSLCQMDTSIPELSAIAWTNLFTGADSGTHGLFGFVDLKPGTYDMYFPNYSNIKGTTIWDELGKRGKRSVVINMPSTYPARSINGILISGFVAIKLEKSVQPLSLLPQLKSMGYRIDVDTMAARKSLDNLVKDLDKTLAIRMELVDQLMKTEDWDFFSPVITGTDRLQHFLMDAYGDESHIYHDFFMSYYEKIDGHIARILDRLDDRTTFLMYSDHGFTTITQEVYLNTWLEQEGYLKFSTNKPEGLQDMAPESRAFALDPSRIYIHTSGRWPNGCVAPGKETEDLVEEICAKALQIPGEDGKPIIKRAYKNEEIFDGPLAAQGPDIVLVSRWGYDLKGAIGRPELFGRTPLTGMHTQDDAMFFINRPFDPGAKMNIAGIKNIVLETLD